MLLSCTKRAKTVAVDPAEMTGGASAVTAVDRAAKRSFRLQTGEQAAKAMFQGREVEAFMSENLEDVVQEGRWRAVLSKNLAHNHRKLLSKMEHTYRMVNQMQRNLTKKAPLDKTPTPANTPTPNRSHSPRTASRKPPALPTIPPPDHAKLGGGAMPCYSYSACVARPASALPMASAGWLPAPAPLPIASLPAGSQPIPGAGEPNRMTGCERRALPRIQPGRGRGRGAGGAGPDALR